MPANATLNQLLIDLCRSLLQYVGESWPWTASTSSARETLLALVQRQQQAVAAIADLLAHRGWTIDFGSYPTEYTDLHYCSLQFLLGELVRSAGEGVAAVESAKRNCAGDPEAAALLEAVGKTQGRLADELKALEASATAGRTILV